MVEKVELTDTTEEKKAYYEESQSIEKQEQEEKQHEVGHGGDTALANAPWKFKLIALVTALMLPVGSHFSASAINAMKKTVKEVIIIIT